jgi:hypothetical protein
VIIYFFSNKILIYSLIKHFIQSAYVTKSFRLVLQLSRSIVLSPSELVPTGTQTSKNFTIGLVSQETVYLYPNIREFSSNGKAFSVVHFFTAKRQGKKGGFLTI